MTLSSHVGQAIKIERKKKKLTQKQLGELIGKSGESIKKYESGFTTIPSDVLFQIADALDITMNELLYNPAVQFDIDDHIPNMPDDFDCNAYADAMDALITLIKYAGNDHKLAYYNEGADYDVKITNNTFNIELDKKSNEELFDRVIRLINGELYATYIASLKEEKE